MTKKKFPTNEKFKEVSLQMCFTLAEIAKKKEMTHEQIAEVSGFARPNVTRMLNGRYPPALDMFLRLSEAIGCSIKLVDDGQEYRFYYK